jgi:hypothetical protein
MYGKETIYKHWWIILLSVMYILALTTLRNIVSINRLILIVTIVGQCDIMTLQIKAVMSVLNIYAYIITSIIDRSTDSLVY